MRLFWLETSAQKGQIFLLNSAQSHRLLHVLRLKVGSEFTARDADRNQYRIMMHSIEGKNACLKVIDKISTKPLQPEIILWQALPKQQRFDHAVQLAVEAGVSRIIPVITEYTQYGNKKTGIAMNVGSVWLLKR